MKINVDMTTMCSSHSNGSLLMALTGDTAAYAPVDGCWTETDPCQFETQVRNLAYGLMVRNYRNGDVIGFSGCTDDMKPFISLACRLSHLLPAFSEDESAAAVIPAQDIDYLIRIGSTWSRKYSSSVDRTITRLMLG